MDNSNQDRLAERYNVAAPRYTSYPTVPYWDEAQWTAPQWISHVHSQFLASSARGISLYIHLPFCESLCTYCGCNTRITRNHGLEAPYVDSVLAEWALYRNLFDSSAIPISDIHLGGGTPTFFSPEQLRRLIEGILSGTRIVTGASFSFEAHPANTTAEHLNVLYQLGFRRLSLGIQDFDETIQRLINRRQTETDVRRVMEDARRIGYTSINFDLIYGLPRQSITTVSETASKALALGPDRISFYGYAHVPWIKPGQRHYNEHDLPRGAERLALYETGKQCIQDAGFRDVGMDHFALPEDDLCIAAESGRLHRNFMGYTDRYTPLLIGLGVSAISDCWTAFAQNVKTVEAYWTLVGSGTLPLAKGHVLTDDDLRVRSQVLDIMCRGYATLDFPSAAAMRVLKRLSQVFTDGLATWDGRYVRVTSRGLPFLRNICMAFDERLHNKSMLERVFSQAV